MTEKDKENIGNEIEFKKKLFFRNGHRTKYGREILRENRELNSNGDIMINTNQKVNYE